MKVLRYYGEDYLDSLKRMIDIDMSDKIDGYIDRYDYMSIEMLEDEDYRGVYDSWLDVLRFGERRRTRWLTTAVWYVRCNRVIIRVWTNYRCFVKRTELKRIMMPYKILVCSDMYVMAEKMLVYRGRR